MRAMKFKTGQKVEVLWKDIVSDSEGWTYEGADDWKIMETSAWMRTMGHVVDFHNKTVYIASTFRLADGTFSNVLAIPLGCIKKIRKIK
jgi:hypothetical protein